MKPFTRFRDEKEVTPFRLNRLIEEIKRSRGSESSSANTASGISGWFDDGVNFRIIIKNGLIVNIVASIGAGYSIS